MDRGRLSQRTRRPIFLRSCFPTPSHQLLAYKTAITLVNLKWSRYLLPAPRNNWLVDCTTDWAAFLSILPNLSSIVYIDVQDCGLQGNIAPRVRMTHAPLESPSLQRYQTERSIHHFPRHPDPPEQLLRAVLQSPSRSSDTSSSRQSRLQPRRVDRRDRQEALITKEHERSF